MAKFSGAKWKPIFINHTKSGMGSVRGVVIHIMAGTLTGTDSWFRNPAARVSSHFGTGKSGALCQWVDTKDKAWAQAGGNTHWLSIENEGRGGDTLTSAQLDRCAEVLAWAHKTYGVPLQVAHSPSGKGLGYHAMGGSSWGGHTSCPGTKIVAQLPTIVARAKKIVGQGGSGGSSTASTYTVKAGDTLSEIGVKVGVPWKTIAALNGIKAPYALKPGQKLKLKGSTGGGSASTYTVQKGDTLSGIGTKTGVKWQTLASLNGLRAPYVIRPGQKLKLKGVSVYTVQRGDTLIGIGGKLGIKWKTLASKNGIKTPYVINPGQKLKL